MISIHNLIAAISPDTFCDTDVRKEVKELVKTQGYLKAAEKAKPITSEVLFEYDEAKKDAFAKWGLQSPIEKHIISYDSPVEGLEPIYFWILDFIATYGLEAEKLTDNFVSSPGSGHFSEVQGKATQMQQEVSRTLGNVNAVIKSILNLVYDLKEFRLRLDPYEMYKSKEEKKKAVGLISLKQIWLDNIDIRKGRGSINALSQSELDFVTLGDAFRVLKSVEDVERLDLNDRVKRLLRNRADEFFRWIDESHNSLNQRFEIEKNYLRSQVNVLKLYSRWVKPYLKAAQKLEQNFSSNNAALVTAFNTMILELSLLAKGKYDPEDDIKEGILPSFFKRLDMRKIYPIVIIEFNFRGIPQRISQRGDWSFGGKTEIKFTSYALNEQELKVFKEEVEKDDVGEIMKLIQGATEDSLKQIQDDIDELLGDKEKKMQDEKTKKETNSGDINPFSALFSFLKKSDKKAKKKSEADLSKGIKPDSKYEQVVRSQAIIEAREKCFKIFEVYKKTHDMPAHSNPFDAISSI